MTYNQFLQEFYAKLRGLLPGVDFDGFTFTHKTTQHIPGRKMMINGRRMDEPDKDIDIILTIEAFETSDVTDENNPIPMAQLHYTNKIQQTGVVLGEFNLGGYLDDMDWFLQPLTK